jgi:ubiquitin carboxyl-terminal hydrolase 10
MGVTVPSTTSTGPNSSVPSPTTSRPPDEADWTEVGKRQRLATTRSSGHPSTSSPITAIFGGQLRSELKVPGVKPSITIEPYQPLQLDIGGDARNVVDALKGLTRPETLTGNFGSPHGPDVKATKQVHIDILPPVLILHLKRFQFEGTSTVKIYKKIGYPLNLEIPREILGGQAKHKAAQDAGYRQYKLTAVVYHHGKNASEGHYTVDVRRQDGQGWIHIDDTKIHPIASENVAEPGAEDKTKPVQADSRKDNSNPASANRFSQFDEDGGEWKPAPSGNKKSNTVVNGSSTPTSNGQKGKQATPETKVAYLLFYQRI